MSAVCPNPPDPFAAEHAARRRVWSSKYAIRACYRGWYERMRPHVAAGCSLEVGSGAGGFSDFWPDLLTSDVVRTPGLGFVADGMRLPVADASLGNLVVIDLLHHLADPHLFFDQATRVLRPGGRVLAIEPFVTPVSYVAYRLLHHEPIWFGGYHRSTAKTDPWEGNLAIANLVFRRQAHLWAERHPHLRIVRQTVFSLFDFQLAGGFKPYAFIPGRRLYDAVLALDRSLDWIARLAGFRIFCVIERVD